MRGLGAWALAGVLAVLVALPARAEMRPLAGQEVPEFGAALELWLAGDEARALPALADLAASDNRAAQVLIGLIDVTPQYQGPWLYALPRAERISLMRAPSGGVSGGNWLRVAAVDVPLAQSWLTLWDGNSGPEAMLGLARLGEGGASRTAAKRLARRAAKGFGAVADDAAFPGFAMGLALREWQTSAPDRADWARAALDPADPSLSLIGPYDPDPTALWALAKTDPALQMLERHLVALCPDPGGRAERLAAALEMLGGWWGLADLGPPAEALIDPESWAVSAQGAAAFVRLLPAPKGPPEAGLDACLAELQIKGAEERKR
ncbi:hypothetical protein [Tabrizicola sp.]|uniref:hypothetical protein n=1 Tax=Tabrizicola sp. TaxID=2005166 RepID=UPI003D2CF041